MNTTPDPLNADTDRGHALVLAMALLREQGYTVTAPGHAEMDVNATIVWYLKTLNAAVDAEWERTGYRQDKPRTEVTMGSKYARVYLGTSIHAFIDLRTGDLLKPAGLNAPAKGARGNLGTPAGRDDIAARMDIYGGYLYAR